jgi:hypothetical protein
MWPFLEWVVGAIVQVLANAVYIDMRRKGIRGFGRFVAFFVGFPWTLTWLFIVEEGSAAELEIAPDDEEQLLREVIRDRIDRDRTTRLGPPGEAVGKD